MNEVAGVILAGGLARRMGGGDKGLILLGGRPILDHVIERLRPQVGELLLNANGDPARFAAYGLPVAGDSIEGAAGPLAGVLAGLDWAERQGYGFIATAATDTPFFPRDLVARLQESLEESGAELALAASQERRHPVFGLWPTALKEELRRAAVKEGLRKVEDWTGRYRVAVVGFAAEGYDPFFNANRPEDIGEAERIWRGHRP